MDTVLDLIITFAVTGETLGLWPGMPGGEADRVLGRGTGLVPTAGTAGDGPIGFKDGSLEVWVSAERRVELLGFDEESGGRFRAPAYGGAGDERLWGPFTWDVVTARLTAAGCTWSSYDALTFADQQAIRTQAGVSLHFRPPESAPDAPVHTWLLEAAYKSFPQNPQNPPGTDPGAVP
ncbi:hypothetical protein [Actinacidiphila acididurans]|uniref:Uncharacterized protein n=1 Tax=Actinacidiphila acididurans TaxID=2784346 RepID=A0ABS2U113_9ACTN|nr:hypothetical protein [Actinacidiphila acididurans]MBM9509289.1 hypothetical protein [Actinacidiphila acididurans]